MALQNNVLLGLTILSLTLLSWGNCLASEKNGIRKEDKITDKCTVPSAKDSIKTTELEIPHGVSNELQQASSASNKRNHSHNSANVIIENSESLSEWNIMFVYIDGFCKDKSSARREKCQIKQKRTREFFSRFF